VISDHLGSPRYAVNVANAGDVPFTASYSSFGEVTGTGLDWMLFGFAGGHYDPDSRLVRFGARDLEPQIGRWAKKDPIHFDGDGQICTSTRLTIRSITQTRSVMHRVTRTERW
jgi:RHS repeat-associated protein